MRVGIANFRGQIPRVHPRLLPDGCGQVAVNTRMTDGSLSPYRASKLDYDFALPVQTVYKHNGAWLGFDDVVNVVPGPVADDRLYYTGDGAPKVKTGATIYSLALAAAVAAPTVTPSGTLDAALREDIVYAYTFVTALDEESPPSPVSAAQAWSPGRIMTLTGFSAAPGGRGINRRRIYRSQTSASGITDLYFVAELPIATTSYAHNLATAPLAEVIPSLDYDSPPATMSGLTELPNGMMAAFDGRELLFCEPFIPHAWPIKYRLKVNYPIVGLASFGSTLAVLTTGTPFIVQGTAPESMVMERLESGLPCIAARGIVDLGYAAAYPTHDGLVLITPSSTQLASRSLYTREEWRALSPETFFAASLEGKYVFAHKTGTIPTFDGGAPSTDFSGFDVYETGGATPQPDVVTYDGGSPLTSPDVRALGVIDLTGEQPTFIDLAGTAEDQPTGLYYQQGEGTLYIISAGETVRAIDSPTEPALNLRWRSRRFMLSSPDSFGAIWVETEEGPSEENHLTTRIIADGVLMHETTDFNKPLRLPSLRSATTWEIEVEGTATISAITMAGSIPELVA